MPYPITSVEPARAAVRNLAPHHPGFVKIWVVDEAHRQAQPAWLDDPLLHETIPPSEIQRLEKQFSNRSPAALSNTRASWDFAGAQSGQDPRGGRAHRLRQRLRGRPVAQELDALAKAGMTPAEVIVASTRLAAETLKLDRLGMVAPLKKVDLIYVARGGRKSIAPRCGPSGRPSGAAAELGSGAADLAGCLGPKAAGKTGCSTDSCLRAGYHFTNLTMTSRLLKKASQTKVCATGRP